MEQVGKGIFYIPGQDEFIPDSHVYVVGERASGDLTLIDAGLMGKGEYKVRSIQENGISPEDIRRVIMTHTHLDHIGCLREILKALPNAELWVHAEEAAPLEEGDERTVYGMDMFQSMCRAQFGIEQGAFKFQVDRKLNGGENLQIGDMAWEVIHVPGHSCGSIALYNRAAKVLIPGDVVYADYAIGRFDLHGASGPELKESLFALSELDVKVLLPGHNRIASDLPADYIRTTAEQWNRYLS